jgi:hypothetical protein
LVLQIIINYYLFSDTNYQGRQKSTRFGTVAAGNRRSTTPDGQKKTLLISQKSFEYFSFYIFKPVSDLSVPIFPSGWSWHLTFYQRRKQRIAMLIVAGCQGFNGPFPSAFLDKRCCKNCGKIKTFFQISKFPYFAQSC